MLSRYGVRIALLAASVTMSCAPAFAQALPRPHDQGGITYITGGIGDTERNALEASKRDYNLHITDSEKDGAFMAGIDLVIQARGGREILQVHNTGPLFYAQLPPGDYTIHAAYKGVQLVKEAKIGDKGGSEIQLVWPQDE